LLDIGHNWWIWLYITKKQKQWQIINIDLHDHACIYYVEVSYVYYMWINFYCILHRGPSWPWSHGGWIYNFLCNQCLSPLMLRVRISFRVRCTTLFDKVSPRLATGRWFSPGPPVSSTNKTDRHDITEILLKVALSTIKHTNKQIYFVSHSVVCIFR
jgi:hypothetical protein